MREQEPGHITETEYCDTCGEDVGYYDPRLPEGEKIVVTRDCACVREDKRWAARNQQMA